MEVLAVLFMCVCVCRSRTGNSLEEVEQRDWNECVVNLVSNYFGLWSVLIVLALKLPLCFRNSEESVRFGDGV